MIDLLETLHKCAANLRRIGMMQSAGDYDYLVAWLRSPEFNNGEHLKPHPAGENTIDAYSNNCPIPFTPSSYLIKNITDNNNALQLIELARDIITNLLDVYTDDIEQSAINVYLDYSNKIVELLGGEVPVPIPPEPEELKFSICGTMAITDDGISSAVDALPGMMGVMQKSELTQSIEMKSFNHGVIDEGGEMEIGELTQSIEMRYFNSTVISEGGSMNKSGLTQSIELKSFNNMFIVEGGSMNIESEV